TQVRARLVRDANPLGAELVHQLQRALPGLIGLLLERVPDQFRGDHTPGRSLQITHASPSNPASRISARTAAPTDWPVAIRVLISSIFLRRWRTTVSATSASTRNRWVSTTA